ncbi:MAG TPA: ABC transporter substrate-binding protein [bacterium]|nr:ABC transporter substrate-binding protein [bacterium]
MKKYLFFFILIYCFQNLFFNCASEKKQTIQIEPVIKIGMTNQWAPYGILIVAQEKGFFKKYGVNVELTLTKNFDELHKLYKSKKLDGIATLFADSILLHGQNNPSKIVYIINISEGADAIIAKPNYKNLASLKNKKISFDGINSFSHILVIHSLINNGLDENDYFFENIPVAEVLKKLEENTIQAGFIHEPYLSEALKKGYKIIYSTKESKDIIIDVLTFHSKTIKEQKKEIQKIINALYETQNFIMKNQQEAYSIISQKMDLSIADVSSTFEKVKIPDLHFSLNLMDFETQSELLNSAKFIADFYINRGQVAYVININSLFDRSFLNQIEK